MKMARCLVLGLAVAMLAGPGSMGCSCGDQGGQVAKDLNLLAIPNYLAFGTVPLNGQKSLTVTLTHIGLSGTVQLTDIELEDLGSEFTFSRPDKASLEVGESTQITVTYAPLAASSPDGALLVRHNVAVLGGLTRIPVTANGQVGDIVVEPNPIEFGQVDVGTDRMLDVQLRNDGSDSVVLNAISLRLDGSPDFTLEAINLPDGATMPYTLAPKSDLWLVMKYKPLNGGADTSTLVIEGDTRGQYAAWSFDVTGEELGPHLVASPGQIDFLWVPLNTQAEPQLLMVENQGNADLLIPAGGLVLWPGSDENISVTDAPAEDLRIAPGNSHEFHLTWKPTVVLPDDGSPIGQLMITSNDLSQSPTAIPIYGRADAPILTVIPGTIDMGFGAMMTPVERQVTLRNDGHGNLNIANLSLLDVSDTRYADEFQLVRGTEKGSSIGAFDIGGAASEGIKVVFTNKAAQADKGQTVTATLRITSNYLGHETIDVPITVTRSDAPICNIALVPMSLNFGTVAIGFPKDMPVRLVNVGTGYCTFRSAQINDCSSGMLGGYTCSAPFSGASSSIFKLSGIPATTTNGLAPGSTTEMSVRFNPPNASPLFGLLNQYGGVLGIKVYDETLKKEIILPKGMGTPATYNANLVAASGIAKISILPGEVKFGVTTIGCFSKTYKVCIYNSGNAPLAVTDVVLKGCSPEFKVKNIPKLPISVQNGAPKCIETVYAPQDEGDDTCILQIEATDASSPTVAVKLTGSGTYETHQVDEFTQVTGQEVDILFIIDDSGSMCEEQTRLNQSFSDFIAQANVWKNDFHIGGISVNVTDEGVIGRLNRGDTKVTPRFMTKSNGGSFSKMTMYGCDGGSDSQEAGMQAAQTALSAPLATDTGVACSTDTECKNDANICPDPGACGYTCIEGTCGGFNSRFLRENAQLEMVALSDEEDQSSGGLPFYVDFFKNIKGWYNVDMMHFNAIVGIEGVPSKPSSNDGDCVASDGGTAASGDRYLQVAEETGGLSGSICESSYSGIMNKIGDVTFHPKVQFFLSRLADPATVSVQVNGSACTTGWRYDAPSNSVIFDLQGSCMPGPGDKIRIEYETLCLTS